MYILRPTISLPVRPKISKSEQEFLKKPKIVQATPKMSQPKISQSSASPKLRFLSLWGSQTNVSVYISAETLAPTMLTSVMIGTRYNDGPLDLACTTNYYYY